MSQGSLFALARRLRGERGQTSAECVVVVVCAIVAVLLNAGIGELLSGTLSRAIAGLGADVSEENRDRTARPRRLRPPATLPEAPRPTTPRSLPPPAQPAEGDGAGEFDSEGASPLDYAREGLAH